MALFKTESITIQKEDPDQIFSSPDDNDFVICKNPTKLMTLINSLAAHKSIWYVSDGDWSMHDLIMQLLKQYNPAELFITTYALREFSVRQLILAQDRKEISSVNMVLDYRAQVRTPEVYQLASLNLNKIYLTGIHAKVTVLKTADVSISIVGSANWTSNPRIEAGVISMNKELAEFNISWIKKVMENAEIFN